MLLPPHFFSVSGQKVFNESQFIVSQNCTFLADGSFNDGKEYPLNRILILSPAGFFCLPKSGDCETPSLGILTLVSKIQHIIYNI